MTAITEKTFVLNGTAVDVFAFIKQNYREERKNGPFGIGQLTAYWFDKNLGSFNLLSLEYVCNKNLKTGMKIDTRELNTFFKNGAHYGSWAVSSDVLTKSGLFTEVV